MFKSPLIPRTTSRQQHHSNTPALAASEYYKRVITITALDHLITEIETTFHYDSSSIVCQVVLLPSTLVETKEVLTSVDIADLVTKYKDDLPAPESLDTELHCWSTMWRSKPEAAANLNTPAKVLRNIDHDFFPNLDAIFKIVCTLAVTSAECKRSVSRLQYLKTYLRSTMTEALLNGLGTPLHTPRHPL